jgi:hypothetical protein
MKADWETENQKATERLRCSGCGQSVSTPVPVGTIVRAYLECPECLENRDGSKLADIEWLNGLSREGGDMGFMAVTLRGDKFHLRCGEGDDAYVAPKPATRDAVRMFCRALGIELREAGGSTNHV